MRGTDIQQDALFSTVSPESRVPNDHPLRPVRVMTDAALIAEFAATVKPPPRRPVDENTRLVRGLLVRRRQLLQMSTMEKSRLRIMPPHLADDIHALIDELQRQVKQIDHHLDEAVQVQSAWQQLFERLIVVPGLGPTSVYLAML